MVVLLGILRFARAAGEFAMVQISLLVSNENGSGCWRGWVSSTIFSSEHFYYRVGIVSQFILIQSVVSHTYIPRAPSPHWLIIICPRRKPPSAVSARSLAVRLSSIAPHHRNHELGMQRK